MDGLLRGSSSPGFPPQTFFQGADGNPSLDVANFFRLAQQAGQQFSMLGMYNSLLGPAGSQLATQLAAHVGAQAGATFPPPQNQATNPSSFNGIWPQVPPPQNWPGSGQWAQQGPTPLLQGGMMVPNTRLSSVPPGLHPVVPPPGVQPYVGYQHCPRPPPQTPKERRGAAVDNRREIHGGGDHGREAPHSGSQTTNQIPAECTPFATAAREIHANGNGAVRPPQAPPPPSGHMQSQEFRADSVPLPHNVWKLLQESMAGMDPNCLKESLSRNAGAGGFPPQLPFGPVGGSTGGSGNGTANGVGVQGEGETNPNSGDSAAGPSSGTGGDQDGCNEMGQIFREKFGEEKFQAVRTVLLEQQEVFMRQVWEVHRLHWFQCYLQAVQSLPDQKKTGELLNIRESSSGKCTSVGMDSPLNPLDQQGVPYSPRATASHLINMQMGMHGNAGSVPNLLQSPPETEMDGGPRISKQSQQQSMRSSKDCVGAPPMEKIAPNAPVQSLAMANGPHTKWFLQHFGQEEAITGATAQQQAAGSFGECPKPWLPFAKDLEAKEHGVNGGCPPPPHPMMPHDWNGGQVEPMSIAQVAGRWWWRDWNHVLNGGVQGSRRWPLKQHVVTNEEDGQEVSSCRPNQQARKRGSKEIAKTAGGEKAHHISQPCLVNGGASVDWTKEGGNSTPRCTRAVKEVEGGRGLREKQKPIGNGASHKSTKRRMRKMATLPVKVRKKAKRFTPPLNECESIASGNSGPCENGGKGSGGDNANSNGNCDAHNAGSDGVPPGGDTERNAANILLSFAPRAVG
ncbi:hypothetical protein BSKO_06427 [Bryopsis sp. KO-2023]|nr:hypothetical protein BSKO_06427 [Bryopsis sp. KO-2023]